MIVPVELWGFISSTFHFTHEFQVESDLKFLRALATVHCDEKLGKNGKLNNLATKNPI